MLIRKIILISITGFIAEIIQIGFLNEITIGYRVIDLLLLLIFYTMLFVDITPAIFLIIYLGFLRDIFTGQYIGANIFCGLSIYAIFLLIHEKLNEEDKYFQIIFTIIAILLWMLLLNLIIFRRGVNIFDIILKVTINGILASFFYRAMKQVEVKIENVFEGQ